MPSQQTFKPNPLPKAGLPGREPDAEPTGESRPGLPEPFSVDRNLRAWASSSILSRGVDYYRKGRVLNLEDYDDRVEAKVEGTLSQAYRVEIRFDSGGFPLSRCECPFKWEPLCKHAVAALLAWQQEATGSEPTLGSPADPVEGTTSAASHLDELERIEREARRAAAKEQGLRIIVKPRSGPLGTYTVNSASPGRGLSQYRVAVRDAEWRFASCECRDFSTNELGTCKHVEKVKAVLESGGRGSLARAAGQRRVISVFIGARAEDGPLSAARRIRVHVPAGLQKNVPGWLTERLDVSGYLLSGELAPEAYAKGLLKRLAGLSRVEIEPEVPESFEAEDSQARWERRVSGISKAHPAWEGSVGKMRMTLHPYQEQGILFAAAKRRAFLADDMGLGKTVQAIGTALLLKELGAVKRVLVVCPASLKFQWKREIERVCSASVEIIGGAARDRDRRYRSGQAVFTLVNYELLYRDIAGVLSARPDLVILDEAQRIKNWETKIAQTVKRLQSPFRLVLTGTPLENRLPELLSLSEFLNPRALGAPWKLVPTYTRFDEEGRVAGYARLDELRARLGRFLLRRSRPEVLSQLPPRTDNHFWTPLTPAQREVHDDLGAQVVRLVNKWKRFKRLTQEDLRRLMMLLNSLRIVSNAYGQYDWKAIEAEVLAAKSLTPELKRKIGSPKLEEFRRIISDLLETPGQKVVVFSQWERMLRLAELAVRDLLAVAGARSVLFSGSLPLKKRAAEVRRFLEDPATRVFFSTDAGGVGLNLQEGANCVVNLDVPWNPAVLEQRIGRVHRMGQKKSVEAIHLVSSESAEERILGLVVRKKALFSGIFNEKAAEVRLDREQMASFMDKMKAIVDQGAGTGTTPQDGSTVPEPQNLADAAADSVAKAAAPSAGTEIDLAPIVAALSGLAAAAGLAGGAAGLKLHVRRDAEGLHLRLPAKTADLARGLAPALRALADLAGGA